MEATWKPSNCRTLAPHQSLSGLVELFSLDQTNGKTRQSFFPFFFRSPIPEGKQHKQVFNILWTTYRCAGNNSGSVGGSD